MPVVCTSLVLLVGPAATAGADTVVRFHTSLGSFNVQLYDTDTPGTVANFLAYVGDGDYTDSFFHRLDPDFVLQGGGFTYDVDSGVVSYVPTDDPIDNEFLHSNVRGTIAMAKQEGDPDSATSQWFFNLLDDNAANLDNQNGGFTVFGHVMRNGMGIVDRLAGAEPNPDNVHIEDAGGAFASLPVIGYLSGNLGPYLEMVYSIAVVDDPSAPPEWKLTGDGSYNNALGWTYDPPPNGVDAEANFLGAIESSTTVTVDSPVTIGTINFESAAPNGYEIAGPAEITLQASGADPQINVHQGDHAISSPLAFTGLTIWTEAGSSLTLAGNGFVDGDLTKTGEGSLVLGSGLAFTGEVSLDQGLLEVGEDVMAVGGAPLNLGAGTTVSASGSINRRVLGATGTTLEITGPADIGALDSVDGYAFRGALEVGPHMVGLRDANEAELCGAHMAGGTVSSYNGIRLLPINVADGLNSRLYGFGTVNGNVVAGIQGNPTPAVVVADPGQTIELTGVVQTGNSTFVNNVVITGTERLGFSPAVGMKLGGAPIGPDAVVEVCGTAGADFESEIPDALAPPVADPLSGYGQFYVAGGESLVSGKITLSTGGSDYVGRGGDTFELIVTGQAWLMDFTQFPPQNVLLPEGSVNIDPGFIVDTSGIPLASPGLFWQEFRSDQGLTLKIVPEPGTLVLLLTGGLGLLAYAWRKRRWP